MGKIFNLLGSIFGWNQNIVTVQSAKNGLYLLNDPSTPDLAIPQILPPRPENLMFTVSGFSPVKLNSSDDKDMYTVNCYITICNSARYFQTMMTQFDRPVLGWSATPNLTVLPFAGNQLNAFYNRASLQFFSGNNPVSKRPINAVASTDIVAHELGHAFLDILRPDFWNVQSFEIWAFHEAFGDINALVLALQHDTLIARILDETKGSPLNSNTVTRMAEEMGQAVFHRKPVGNSPHCIRDISNNFKYANPHRLPQKGPDEELCAESHNFSRVFSGAWYEILVKIFERERTAMGDMLAFKHARDVAYGRLLKAIKNVPNTIRFFDALAKCMIAVEKMKNNAYTDIMEQVFTDREILKPTIRLLSSNITYNDILVKLDKKDSVCKKGDTIMIHRPKTKKFRISDHLVTDLSSSNPLYDVEMEVPGDSYYLFDNKQLVDEIHSDDSELLESSLLCALSIKNHQGLGEDQMWRISQNKLVRNHVACCHRAT
jgi:hypothetical protein